MIFLDTSVLSYAVGGEHPLRAPCQRLLGAHSRGTVACVTSVEVIQEFAHVRARRRPRVEAVARALDYAQALSLFPTGYDDLRLGLSLFEQYPALGSFDAVLAAVALNNGAEALVSADRAFGVVARLRWIDPATDGLTRLIIG